MLKRDEVPHLSKAGLKARGWTEAGISRFLGEADKTAVNPHYRSAAPTCLYALPRIEAAEASIEFQAWKEKSIIRKQKALQVVGTKRDQTLTQISNVTLRVRKLSLVRVLSEAIENYNNYQLEIGNFEAHATKTSDTFFLQRIQVNYIRHCLTEYDEILYDLIGKIGKHEAYGILSAKIFAEIGTIYPHLATECTRQLEKKFT